MEYENTAGQGIEKPERGCRKPVIRKTIFRLTLLVLVLTLLMPWVLAAPDDVAGQKDQEQTVPGDTAAGEIPAAETVEPGTQHPETVSPDTQQAGGLTAQRIQYDEKTNKQFITLRTRNGDVFYLIIDYDKPTDEAGDLYETYFLSQVDDHDLQGIREEEETVLTCDCAEKCRIGSINTACSLCRTNMSECLGRTPAPQDQETAPTVPAEDPAQPSQKKGTGQLLRELLIFGAVGAGAVFLVKVLLDARKSEDDAKEDNEEAEDAYMEFEKAPEDEK